MGSGAGTSRGFGTDRRPLPQPLTARSPHTQLEGPMSTFSESSRLTLVPVCAGRSLPSPSIGPRQWLVRLATIGAPLLISAAAVAGLVSAVGLNGSLLQGMLDRLDARMAVLLTCLFALPQATRILRLRWLLPESIGWFRVMSIVLMQQFFVALLPWKLGDLSVPMMLKREGVRVTESLALLVLTRWLDTLAVVVLLTIAMILFWPELPTALQRCWPAVAVAACLATLLLVTGLGVRQPTVRRRASLWATRFQSVSGRGWPWLIRHLGDGYRTFSTVPWPTLLAGAVVTLGLWVFSVAFNVIFCIHFAPQLQWPAVTVVVLLAPLINHLPVRGLAGIGTTEAIAVLIFSLAGMHPTEALVLGLWGHICNFALIAAAGLVGLALRWFADRAPQALRQSRLSPAETHGDE